MYQWFHPQKGSSLLSVLNQIEHFFFIVKDKARIPPWYNIPEFWVLFLIFLLIFISISLVSSVLMFPLPLWLPGHGRTKNEVETVSPQTLPHTSGGSWRFLCTVCSHSWRRHCRHLRHTQPWKGMWDIYCVILYLQGSQNSFQDIKYFHIPSWCFSPMRMINVISSSRINWDSRR